VLSSPAANQRNAAAAARAGVEFGTERTAAGETAAGHVSCYDNQAVMATVASGPEGEM